MSDADKIKALRDALSTMIEWTDMIRDEDLDGDDETRKQFVRDRQEARAAMLETKL